MALRAFLYGRVVVRTFAEDGTLLSSFEGSFDGLEVLAARDELRLFFDLPHFLAWLGSPNGTRLDMAGLAAFRLRHPATGADPVELRRCGKRVMEIERRADIGSDPDRPRSGR
jgi:hypothetical protein